MWPISFGDTVCEVLPHSTAWAFVLGVLLISSRSTRGLIKWCKWTYQIQNSGRHFYELWTGLCNWMGQSCIDQCRDRPGEEQKRSQLVSHFTTLWSYSHIIPGRLLREILRFWTGISLNGRHQFQIHYRCPSFVLAPILAERGIDLTCAYACGYIDAYTRARNR